MQVRYEGPSTAPVMAVPTAPEQIIDNFVDTPFRRVRMAEPSPCGLSGPGLTRSCMFSTTGRGSRKTSECNRAFDRFWRATSTKEGNGLGLAIVAQLALASGAEARLAPRPQGGLYASVRFTTARSRRGSIPRSWARTRGSERSRFEGGRYSSARAHRSPIVGVSTDIGSHSLNCYCGS